MIKKVIRWSLAHDLYLIYRLGPRLWANACVLRSLVPGMFDSVWYQKTYFLPVGTGPWRYFIETGYRLGHNPNPIFDTAWYREQYFGKSEIDANPFLHFLEHGASGDFCPGPLFDTHYYFSKYPDVAQSGLNPLSHFLANGAAEKRDPCMFFSSSWYLEHNPEVERAGQNPLVHFLLYGAKANKDPHPYFDMSWYRTEYLSDADQSINPLIHFLTVGEKLGFRPGMNFDSEWYLLDNPDVAAMQVDPLRHFLEFGLAEGRTGVQEQNQFLDIERLKQVLGGLPASASAVSASINLRVSSVADYVNSGSDQENNISLLHSRSNAAGIQEHVRFPGAPYVAKLHDVLILAGTRYVLANNNTILHDEEFEFQSAEDAATKYYNACRSSHGTLKLKFSMRQASWVARGINLMHEYSVNYFHFIAETMPRMLLAEELEIPLEVPYLFEDSLHPNMRYLIDLLNPKKRPVLYLQSGHIYNVATMYLPSDMTSVVDAYHGGPELKQTVLEVNYIREAINRCLTAFPVIELRWPRRKIYATRSSGYRKLLNEAELETKLAALGFEILKTEGLNVETQARIFRDASIVVGPTGANLANMVWCDPGTKVVVLASDHPSHQLYFWELLGRVSFCEVSIIQGPRAFNRDDKYSLHDDYYIDVDAVVASLQSN